MHSNRNSDMPRHRAGALRVPESSRTSKMNKNIDLYNFAIFVSGGFSKLSQAVSELESSDARQSMQNDLAHRTERARFPMDGCAGS